MLALVLADCARVGRLRCTHWLTAGCYAELGEMEVFSPHLHHRRDAAAANKFPELVSKSHCLRKLLKLVNTELARVSPQKETEITTGPNEGDLRGNQAGLTSLVSRNVR